MLDQECGREANSGWVRRQFLVETHASKLKGKTETMIKKCFEIFSSIARHKWFSCDCWTYV